VAHDEAGKQDGRGGTHGALRDRLERTLSRPVRDPLGRWSDRVANELDQQDDGERSVETRQRRAQHSSFRWK
jgi:hypothetical protein